MRRRPFWFDFQVNQRLDSTGTSKSPQSQWAQLSGEIWGLIFSSLVNQHPNDDRSFIFEPHQQQEGRTSLHKLQTVCKACRGGFVQHPSLHQDVLLGSQFKDHNLPNLIDWIRLYGDAVQSFRANCGSQTLMMALAALCMRKCCLKVVSLMQVTKQSLNILAAMHTLTKCYFGPSPGEMPSLQNFCTLPNLTHLGLHGASVTHLDALAHLTCLTLSDCHAMCYQDSKFVSSLLSLVIEDATISRFHHKGISACYRLRYIWFGCATIAAIQDAESFVFDDDRVCIPRSLWELTALTSLQVQSHLATNMMSCLWLSQLASLKELGITRPATLIKFPSFSSLSSLEYVRMDFEGVWSKPVIEFEEEVLVPLQYMKFSGTVTLKHVFANAWHLKFSSLAQPHHDTRRQLLMLPHTVGSRVDKNKISYSFAE